ncbi:type IX secretion system plug protein [Solitalea koreensis]|uniref:Type 9 secretion system plug protein N-terminal domain-containing protein n=1 Tax=Solitalea koreensis TaxID=543615 RepID=A0A521D711_9SPHI|nr:DUF5103 domain-containing protein [Solitalea koreensis]SMO67493.1 protein of unknown function [Solitalea koreensis]
MKSTLKVIILFFILFSSTKTVAVSDELVYKDWVYKPNIKTVQFYNVNQEQSTPIYVLGSADKLVFSFDDINGGSENYTYTFIHCTYDWKPSNVSSIDYLNGYSEDRINDYEYSLNTFQAYTHYKLALPNNNMKPLIGGNYLLKVYLNNDPNDLVITRRFYVLNNKVSIDAELARSSVINDRERKQKLNFIINHPAINVFNPQLEIKAVVTQNDRPDNAQVLTQPLFIRNNQLVYDNIDACVFNGGSEFRHIDTRSLRFFSDRIQDIVREKGKTDVYLFADADQSGMAYSSWTDINGTYLIRNQDGSRPETDGDYTWVHFSLAKPYTEVGDYYVFGKLSDWQIKEEFRLGYNEVAKTYQNKLLLKQGYYDYQYVYVSPEKPIDETVSEGNHFETENMYTIYVYYHPSGKRYDDLVGVRKIGTNIVLRIR